MKVQKQHKIPNSPTILEQRHQLSEEPLILRVEIGWPGVETESTVRKPSPRPYLIVRVDKVRVRVRCKESDRDGPLICGFGRCGTRSV